VWSTEHGARSVEHGVCGGFVLCRSYPMHSILHTPHCSSHSHSTLTQSAVHIHTPHLHCSSHSQLHTFTRQFTFTLHTLHFIHPTLYNLQSTVQSLESKVHWSKPHTLCAVHRAQCTVHTPAFYTPDFCWISLDNVRCSKLSKSLPTSLFTNPTFKKLKPSFGVQLSQFGF
jgi:hypothetical protein